MSNKIHKGYGKLVQWADELKAEVFGTLTFRQQLKLHEVDAQANEFFNKLDRAFFGANYKRKGKFNNFNSCIKHK